jgi:8-oxo-dGTP pyrophosphatase MutT (NUDIX family)
VISTLEKLLHHYKKKEIINNDLTAAAVLVPLFYKGSGCHVLFTRRSREVNSHKDEICFPGGVYQLDDADLLHTALREAEEEIALKAMDVNILGELDDYITRSGYVISPFVAFIPYPYPFKANSREVARIFSIPLSDLMDEIKFKQDYHMVDGVSFLDYCYRYEGEIVWGATARITRQLVELLKAGAEAS